MERLGRTSGADRVPSPFRFFDLFVRKPGDPPGPNPALTAFLSGEMKTPQLHPEVAFGSPVHRRFIRVEFDAPAVTSWTIAELMLENQNQRVDAGGPYRFHSAWKAATGGEEWRCCRSPMPAPGARFATSRPPAPTI
jgi:hypothetical protein